MRLTAPVLALAALALVSTVPSAGAQTTAPVLVVTKTDAADPVTVGGDIVYTIVVTNSGTANAAGVVLTDVLPTGVTFVGATTTRGTCTYASATRTLSCALGTLNTGGGKTATIALTVTADAAGTVTNTASATTTTSEPDTSDNSDTEETTVRTAPPQGLECEADDDGIHLSWDAVAQATGYNVYRATGPSGSFVFIDTTTSTTYLDSTAANGQVYRYRVTSLSAGGESANSDACLTTAIPYFGSLALGTVAVAGSVGAYAALRRRRP